MDVRDDIAAVLVIFLMVVVINSQFQISDGSITFPINNNQNQNSNNENASDFKINNNTDEFVSRKLLTLDDLQTQKHYQQNEEQQLIKWGHISGNIVEIGEFPGQISLQNRAGSHFCSGTLINDQHILTAAHCIVNKYGFVRDPQTIQVMGDDLSVNFENNASTRQLRLISHIFAHENYNLNTFENDIAVLRLIEPFQLSDTFFPIEFNTITPPDDDWLRVAGWITMQENTADVSVLRSAYVQKISNIKCSQRYRSMIKETMICAGIDGGGIDSCQGDSGSGLIYQGTLAGVVSFGIGCTQIGFPAVYTDVTYYFHFIENSIEFNDGGQENVPIPNPFIGSTKHITHGSGTSLIIWPFWWLFILSFLYFGR